MSEPSAVVSTVGDHTVIDDPTARGFIRGIGKAACKGTLKLNADRVAHFMGRIAALSLSWDDVVIVLLNVDDRHGGQIADILMPDHGRTWQAYRDRGQIPFARGLAPRRGIQSALLLFDQEAAAKLSALKCVAVVVVDHGVAEVFAVTEASNG